jgi:hypothetical protein
MIYSFRPRLSHRPRSVIQKLKKISRTSRSKLWWRM